MKDLIILDLKIHVLHIEINVLTVLERATFFFSFFFSVDVAGINQLISSQPEIKNSFKLITWRVHFIDYTYYPHQFN